MRRLFYSLPIALAGAVAAAPSAAQAGLDAVCSTCGGQPKAGTTHAHKAKAKARHLCVTCAAREAGSIPADAMPVTLSPDCAACAMFAKAGPFPAAAMPAAPVLASASAPGVAVVGEAPAPMLATGPGGAPGHAVVGGAPTPAEPMPVGVMRTNYSAAAAPAPMPGTLGASVHASQNPAAGNIPYARPDELPPSIYAPQRPRRSILSRLLLPDFGRRQAMVEERARERHAMTSFGAQGPPSELSADMVYGKK